MPEKQYGQGMVRPGCWFRPSWGHQHLDRQYGIATGIYSFHYDIASFWDGREPTPEGHREIRSLFVATSPDLSAIWWTPTARYAFSTYVPIEPVWCPLLDATWSGGRDA